MNQIELNPCPWCGGLNLILSHSTPDREGVPCNIRCDDCGSSGPGEYIPEETLAVCDATDSFPARLVQLWNSRPRNRQRQRPVTVDHAQQMLVMFANSAINGMLLGVDNDIDDEEIDGLVETAWRIAKRMYETAQEVFSED